jgi:hypothetical protein
MNKVSLKTATMKEKICYHDNFACIQKYIDSRLDILEHKFLAFVFHVDDDHCVVSVVVINPFLVFERYLNKEKELSFIDGALDKSRMRSLVGGVYSIQCTVMVIGMDSGEPLTRPSRNHMDFIIF